MVGIKYAKCDINLLFRFIFAQFGGHSQQENIGNTFFGLYIGLVVLLVSSMARDCWKDIKVTILI